MPKEEPKIKIDKDGTPMIVLENEAQSFLENIFKTYWIKTPDDIDHVFWKITFFEFEKPDEDNRKDKSRYR